MPTNRKKQQNRRWCLCVGLIVLLMTGSSVLEGQTVPQEDVYVVLIGINQYKHRCRYKGQTLCIETLKYPAKDVQGVYNALTGPGRIPPRNVKILLNQKATKTQISNLLRTWLKKKLGESQKRGRRATVLIFFSGHGLPSQSGESYWIAFDTQVSSFAKVEETGINSGDVQAWLAVLSQSSRRVVLFVDACNSGFAWAGQETTHKKNLRMLYQGFKQVLGPKSFEGEGRITISSSRQDQFSVESPELKHGVFSYALIQALTGAADYDNDGVVTLSEVWNYLSSHVTKLAARREHGGYPQVPVQHGTIAGAIPLSFPRSNKSRLEIRSTPSGATVRIGGYHVGTTPYEADQEPGDKSVEVQLSGHKVWRERIQLQPRQTRTLQVTLEKQDSPPVPPPPAPAAEPPTPRPAQPQPTVDSSQSRRPRHPGMIGKVKGMPGAQVIYIPLGTFWMGSPDTESGKFADETPRHQVKLTNGIWMWRTETTQGQFKTLLGYNPSGFKNCGNCPVEQVNFHEAMAFANAVSTKEGREPCYECTGKQKGVTCKLKAAYKGDNGKGYYKCPGWRLPTEAEWEYAARAGTEGARYGELDSIAWYDDNAGGKTHPVCTKSANKWGLCDMLGNVEEWTWDVQGTYPSDSLSVDPVNAQSHLDDALSNGSSRVVRGGSWFYFAWSSRAAYRYRWRPRLRDRYLGFRVVRVDLPVDR